ncbi:MAG: hypothetical protein ACE5JS_18430 [Nitrospinota bacterium]
MYPARGNLQMGAAYETDETIARHIFALREQIIHLKVTAKSRAETEKGVLEIEARCRQIMETVNAMPERPQTSMKERRRRMIRQFQQEVSSLKKHYAARLVCPFCDRIGDRAGNWVPMDSPRFGEDAPAEYRTCPTCLRKQCPEVYLG